VAQLSPHEEEAHSQSLPFKTFRAPDKGAPLQVPLKSPYKEGCPFPEPVFLYLQGPQRRSSWSLFRERDASSTEPPLPSLKVPGR